MDNRWSDAQTAERRSASPVETAPERLAHMLGTDLRDSVPPQLFALIAAIASRLEEA